jgi:L-ascorbate metabolism protein UlaG (beta-lactamase superfamily)
MIQITWLGHATFQFRFESGEVLVLDPFIEGNSLFPKDHQFQRVDAIAVSHAHSDHTNDLLPLAKKFNSKVVCIFELANWLEQKGIKNTVGINKGGTADLGFARLTMTHALHSSSIKDGNSLIYGGEAAGFVIHSKHGKNAYFAGDTAVFSDMSLIAQLYAPEIAMLPIGDHFTMGPAEAALAARMLKAPRVIPMHYGTFPVLTGRPEQLQEKLLGTGISVWTLKPGQPVDWAAQASTAA